MGVLGTLLAGIRPPVGDRPYLWCFLLAGLRIAGVRLQLNSAVPSCSPSGHPVGEGCEEPHDLSVSNSCTQLEPPPGMPANS